MKKDDYIRIKHDYMYRVYLLTEKIDENKFKCVQIWQSSDGFSVSVSKEIIDIINLKVGTYYDMSDYEISRFLNWLFEWSFHNPDTLTIK